MTGVSAKSITEAIRELGDKEIAAHSQRFFKTGPGEYGEGDVFIGVRVPVLRKQVREFRGTPLKINQTLLHSKFHEIRLFALLLLVDSYRRGDAESRDEIYRLYLDNTQWINNWDLVDCSAMHIVGPQLEHKSRKKLYSLARSTDMWERRIAIMATLHFIKQKDFDDTLALADRLLGDPEDLIHKAVGWMLREVGNRDKAVETEFLLPRYRQMPRTMLRYAIEKFPDSERKSYLAGTAQ